MASMVPAAGAPRASCSLPTRCSRSPATGSPCSARRSAPCSWSPSAPAGRSPSTPLTWALAAPCCSPGEDPAAGAHGVPQRPIAELREGWTFFRVDHVAVGRRPGVRSAQHDPQRRALHPRPGVAEDTIGRQGWGFVLSAEARASSSWRSCLLRFRLERPLLLGHARRSASALAADDHAGCRAGARRPRRGRLRRRRGHRGLLDGLEPRDAGEHRRRHAQSRAYSYDMLGSFVAMPIGQLAWGPLGVGRSATSGSSSRPASRTPPSAGSCSARAPCATCRGHRRPPWPR